MAADMLRLGSRVVSTRMEFSGAGGKLLPTGAAAYAVSGRIACGGSVG